ncbi:MAG: Asp-tRNA(Asn)/Glu-tRNA(Gln) amidotransferase subunit GatB [Flavobacteriales bacterium]
MLDKYTATIGLEVHIQLQTNSKVFSSDKNEYGEVPNTNVSPISLGHPGTLPRLNEQSVNHAISLGLACNANIHRDIHFARKNYFYADLPKGYQITQDETPICTGGAITIDTKDSEGKPIEKDIPLIRIHMEEDSGKSIHDQDPFNTLVDLNRAGVPLLEMVSEPEVGSAEEAYQYLTEVRRLVRYLEICDGNMEEGSLRCDANVSVHPKGKEGFGTRTEVKNMNSMRNVRSAIEHEIERQIEIIEKGEEVIQETRNFDAIKGITIGMRGKEMAHDYRYFPEPDLQPLKLEEDDIQEVKNTLPPLPRELFHKYIKNLGLPEYDAGVITDDKESALFFEELTKYTSNYKAASNWVMGQIRSYLNENALKLKETNLKADKIGALIEMIENEQVSNSVAEQEIFPKMTANPDKAPYDIAKENDLLQESDDSALKEHIKEAIEKYPGKVEEYKNGKKGLVGLFMGEVMKKTKGKADPKKANQLVREMLEEV